MISYDDFAKLEIRIGEIRTVEILEGADKLLLLSVNLGETDTDGNPTFRQIVSGIRQFFDDPAALIGTKCPFLSNLEPRTIRGYESQGMILATGGKEGVPFALLIPSADLPPGTRVS